jgi:hypothetical protein
MSRARHDRDDRPGASDDAPGPSPRPGGEASPRRLIISICPRESGEVALPVERGGRVRRLDATGVLDALRELVARRQLEDRVTFREGCAGGCGRPGPNVDVTIHLTPLPGQKPDHIALGWKTYVYSLASLDCLATVIDENLRAAE